MIHHSRKEAIEKFFTELNGNIYDIKAEALVNQALHFAMNPDDFVVMNDGRFYREYRNDVYAVTQTEDASLHQWLQLHLSLSLIHI